MTNDRIQHITVEDSTSIQWVKILYGHVSGSMGPPKREKAWQEKRVFFLTPQVLTNDLSRGSCPAEDVKCLVIDEAHKALGNHAYCQVFTLN